MKKALWMVLVILCGFCSIEAKTVDRIYAQVNDDIITLSDINRRVQSVRLSLSQKLSGEPLEQAVQKEKEKVLDTLVQEKLMVQKAIELGIDADIGPKIASEVQRFMKEYEIEDMDKLEDALEQQNSSLEDLREVIRNQILVDEVLNMYVRSRITLMTQEVEKFYKDHATDYTTPEELSLSEILLTFEHEGGQDKAENRARDLYSRLKNGEAFKSLASQFSSGATANKGGDIGNNLIEKWHPDIIKAVAGLEDGDISEPQKTVEGFVIYRIEKRKHSKVRPLAEVENAIKNRIYAGKFDPEFERFVTRLKEEAYIQIYPEAE
jgi:peptidyl-prolyl cis-trans isomerase SurA